MCFVIWLHCFGAEGGQKTVGMCWEKSCLQDHESICNVCFNAFQTVMGQNYSSNRIYIWTMMQFYCKDPEFVQIICFDIALQESCWPLASDLHWSYELMPKRYCSKTADFFSCQSTEICNCNEIVVHSISFFFQFPWIHLICFISFILKKHQAKAQW